MNTRKLTCGDKVFTIRTKIPLKLLDEVVREQKRIVKLEEDDDKELASIPLRDMVFKRMVVDPIITDEYLDNEADLDDFDAALQLLMEIGETIRERFDEEKKKGLSLPDSKPGPQSRIGPPGTPTKPNG